MDNFKTKLEQLQTAYNKAEKDFLEASKKYFRHAVEDIFIKHPDLKEFSFVMYTPSFNDGDPCYFTVNYDYAVDSEGNELSPEIQETIRNNLDLFPDTFYEQTFGSATKLTCLRNGEIKEDYYDCGY